MNYINVVMLTFLILSFSSKGDKYLLDFDLNSGVVLNSEENKAIMRSITEKYEKHDSIFIAVAFYHPSLLSQGKSCLLRNNIQKELSVYLKRTKIKLLSRFDKKSVFNGIYFEKKDTGKITEHALLIQLKNK